jgi:hypothetical protein
VHVEGHFGQAGIEDGDWMYKKAATVKGF